MDRTPAATLTKSLLVRKGAAMPTLAAPSASSGPATNRYDPPPHLVLLDRDTLADDTPHIRSAARGHGHGGERRRRITLRLDAARHRRLKLAATHLGVSLQDVLIAALDGHLTRVAPGIVSGGCACLSNGSRGEETSQ